MATEQTTIENPAIEIDGPDATDRAYRVILYNDDWHGFDEVAEQLHKATEYSMLKCQAITIKVDQEGRAVCYNGRREKCHDVTKVLREIRLQCEVDCD